MTKQSYRANTCTPKKESSNLNNLKTFKKPTPAQKLITKISTLYAEKKLTDYDIFILNAVIDAMLEAKQLQKNQSFQANVEG